MKGAASSGLPTTSLSVDFSSARLVTHINHHVDANMKILQNLEVLQWISNRYLENINTHSIMSLASKPGYI